ncbi:hypothetical protein BKA66DRAFT_573962 [Pyrenochaeta sp. MPI-SDFR-AT-0127]|nr:hypothetical protein BKA66DRAFT_573962 [Pyrenochaeta sp. MPI-SDFR-AT-0127]
MFHSATPYPNHNRRQQTKGYSSQTLISTQLTPSLMTARLLRMQSLGGFRYHEPELNQKTMPEMPGSHGTQDGWHPTSRGGRPPSSATNYFGFPVANISTSDGHFLLDPTFAQKKPFNQNDKPLHNVNPNAQPAGSGFASRAEMDANTSALSLSTHNLYPSSLIFTPTNMHDPTQDTTALSPLVPRFDSDQASPESNGTFSYGEQPRSPQSSKFMQFTAHHQQRPAKRRCDSLQVSLEAHSPTTQHPKIGRRRRSEFAEPGSARAVYLEKNRKAASKCRSKQKMQQEELVETARDAERKNRALKAEVELLKGGMRELMDIVGQHTDCPDGRLRTYVQREADRLASGITRPVQPSLSSGSSFSRETISPKTSSSPDKR